MRQIFKRSVATLLSSMALSCGISLAQSYPSRPISIVVPYGPGSGNDLIAREIAQQLEPLTDAGLPWGGAQPPLTVSEER